MKRIEYSPEFKILIAAFFRTQNREWLFCQIVMALTCLLIGYLEISSGKNPSWGTLILVQGMSLLFIFRNLGMQVRYETGVFLTGRAEIVLFMIFAIKKMKKNKAQLEKEITEMLAECKGKK